MLSHSPITASIDTLQTILNAVPNPVFLKDRAHRLVLANDAFCELLGQSRNELIDRDGERIPDEQRDVFWKVDDEVFATGRPNENEEVLTDGTGALRVILTRKRLVHLPTEHGVRPFIIAVISDVTRFREAEARAQYLAEHDFLTGLANRTQLNDRLSAILEKARRTDGKVALLFVDLDGFKAVNDHYGHPVGDALLCVIAKRLARLVRTVDVVARLGGDEFCIIQSAVQQPHGASGLAERCISSISQPIVIGAQRLSVTASVGIALFPDDGNSEELLMQRADEALYAAKKAGRDRHYRYDRSGSVGQSSWDIERDLHTALSENQLSLVFQPISTASDGKVSRFEALVRWQHPTRGAIPPDEFIPAAESAGVIQRLGAWVLRNACAAAAGWTWKTQVSVNVSPTQMESGELPAVVEKALTSSGLPASRLELEVTEAALLSHSETVASTFAQLKQMGVSIALDDFGGGWSSLATLRNYRFDRIKIDRSFIMTMESDTRSAAIVRAVLNLARALEVPVTAEGVEAHEQLNALRQMGCAELQGFYVGRPNTEAILPDSRLWRTLAER